MKWSVSKKIKLWLFYKLDSWYNNYIKEDKVWSSENRKFREYVHKKIRQDFGAKCQGQCLSCCVCQAYLALDIIQDLYLDDTDKPVLFNKCSSEA